MILPVILTGGTGSRLWPLSRELHPKQFLSIHKSETMLQDTVKRLEGISHLPPMFVCNEEHRFILSDQLSHLEQSNSGIILEPVGRNTAPAIALAAFAATCSDDDPLLLVLPADHNITHLHAFWEAIHQATPYANEGNLVTFGVVPTRPETGYGYIRAKLSEKPASYIEAVVEKPSQDIVQSYVDSGEYFWNSGMFLFKASVYLKELNRFRPDIYAQCKLAMQLSVHQDNLIRVDTKTFEACPKDSIDYAVMEKTSNAMVVPLDAGWSDVGSWEALWDIDTKNEQGNVLQGDIISMDTENSYIRSDEKLVVTLGLKDVVVINTKDAVLVASKDKVQDVKKVVEKLNEEGRSEAILHREVYRPWGKYDGIDQGPRYQVKRITVNPGEKLSIQMHHHRAEHWIVVSGTAKVTNGDNTYLLTENQSTYIPVGVVHALENPGKVPLEIIEVQSGSYLGEDDIVRFEDKYGRPLMGSLQEEPEVV